MVPVGGIHLLERGDLATSWISQVQADRWGFGFMVHRRWRVEERPVEWTQQDEPRDWSAASDVESTGIWGAVAEDAATVSATQEFPLLHVDLSLPDGRSDLMVEPESHDERIERWEDVDVLLSSNTPARSARISRYQTSLDSPAPRWATHEVDVVVWCKDLPTAGDVGVGVGVRFGSEGDRFTTTLDGSAILEAASASPSLWSGPS